MRNSIGPPVQLFVGAGTLRTPDRRFSGEPFDLPFEERNKCFFDRRSIRMLGRARERK